MKPILVTGATGFLGKHLVSQLLAEGKTPLRLLCRGESPFPSVETIRGDVTNKADAERAVKGVSKIYHLAGMVSRDPKDATRMMEVHVGGTRNILDAARKFGIEKVVAASSSGTIAVSRKPVIHTEESGFQEELAARWPYYVSKIAEEKLVLEYSREHRLPLVVINPSLLLGPGDDRNSSTGDVRAILEGQVLSYPTGGLNFVDARDCAAAAIAAMEKGRPGERFLLGGPNWTSKQFIQNVCRLAGVRQPLASSPVWLALLSAPILRKLMPLAGRKFDIDDTTIEMSGVFWYCDSAKAARELGFAPRDPVETLRETIEYMRRK